MKIGVYTDGVWYLDRSGNGAWDGALTDGLHYFGGGLTGAVPVTGDWTGTGTMKIGIYQDGVWYLDPNGNGAWDGTPTDGLYYFGGGLAGGVPVTGDWTGTGSAKIGVYAEGVWYFDLNGNGGWDGTPTDGLYYFGGRCLTGAVPVTGGTGPEWDPRRSGCMLTEFGMSIGEWERRLGRDADRWSLLFWRWFSWCNPGCREMKILFSLGRGSSPETGEKGVLNQDTTFS